MRFKDIECKGTADFVCGALLYFEKQLYFCSHFVIIKVRVFAKGKAEDIMDIGASSSCFYPMETEKALLQVAELGFKKCEIFFNSTSELERPFVTQLAHIRDSYAMEIVSLHPYESFAEEYNIFSEYGRRFTDAKVQFKRYYEAAATLGAKYIVLHGSRKGDRISRECYGDRFAELAELAQTFGCTLAHENVVDYLGGRPEFMAFLKGYIGDSFKAVLDIKQARRAGIAPETFIDVLGSSIVHVHISDFTKDSDCAPVTEKGMFDFEKLFTALNAVGYEGDYILELYRKGFGEPAELSRSAEILRPILAKATKGV